MNRDEILREIDRATEPAKMSKRQALDWLEELATDIDSRCEALRDKLRTEGED